MNLTLEKKHRQFGGEVHFYTHQSMLTKTPMNFSCFIPGKEIEHCLIFLSGLTCTEENFITKSYAQYHLAQTKTLLVCPDTSPRGLNLSCEHDSYDFGSGASFYVNATTAGYRDHYQMYDYIKTELTSLIKDKFSLNSFSLMGHSMGGHGALVLGLRESSLFQSVSAFSPIVHPSQCPWGEKAFLGYLGEDREEWKNYDAVELLKKGHRREDSILIHQGENDEFLINQLKPQHFIDACQDSGQEIDFRLEKGFDHSYYFISTFIEEHIRFHCRKV